MGPRIIKGELRRDVALEAGEPVLSFSVILASNDKLYINIPKFLMIKSNSWTVARGRLLETINSSGSSPRTHIYLDFKI